jgi:hypothetical protein
MLNGQDEYRITIDFEAVERVEQIEKLKEEAEKLR